MRTRRFLPIAAALSLFAVAPGAAHTQSASSSSAATQQTDGVSAAGAAAPAGQSTPSPNAKPGKVWTNDEIDRLSGDHGVSVVGKNAPRNAGARSPSTNTKSYSQDKDPAWYRDQLQPLQAEIEKLDAQIEKTKAFLNGEKVNDVPASTHAYYGVAGNPQEQLTKLEAKRDKDVAKVNDLLDRARHNDIPPGALR